MRNSDSVRVLDVRFGSRGTAPALMKLDVAVAVPLEVGIRVDAIRDSKRDSDSSRVFDVRFGSSETAPALMKPDVDATPLEAGLRVDSIRDRDSPRVHEIRFDSSGTAPAPMKLEVVVAVPLEPGLRVRIQPPVLAEGIDGGSRLASSIPRKVAADCEGDGGLPT